MKTAIPPDLIEVGRIVDAYGVKGGIKIQPHSQDARALLETRAWWLGEAPEMRDVEVLQARKHGASVTAQLVGIADRDMALALKGTAISIARSRFPSLDDEEYYWVDLIGLDAVNLAGEPLGKVVEVGESGAHPILEVCRPGDDVDAQRLLIPFVDAVVKTVDLNARRLVADWQLDY